MVCESPDHHRPRILAMTRTSRQARPLSGLVHWMPTAGSRRRLLDRPPPCCRWPFSWCAHRCLGESRPEGFHLGAYRLCSVTGGPFGSPLHWGNLQRWRQPDLGQHGNNPLTSEVMCIKTLATPPTVNTTPKGTLKALRTTDIATLIRIDGGNPEEALKQFGEAGIHLWLNVSSRMGQALFVKSRNELMGMLPVERRRTQ
jgi:hypothetical protein